ncbi:MAG: hypothetical protein WBO19_14770, partial [Terriglobia bacterium]
LQLDLQQPEVSTLLEQDLLTLLRQKSPSHFTFPKILCRIWNFLAPLREGRITLRAALQRGSRFL